MSLNCVVSDPERRVYTRNLGGESNGQWGSVQVYVYPSILFLSVNSYLCVHAY